MSESQNQIPLTREEAAEYIKKNGGSGASITPKTLGKYASVGGGPKYHKYGRRVVYFPSDLDEWMRARMTPKLANTSQDQSITKRVREAAKKVGARKRDAGEKTAAKNDDAGENPDSENHAAPPVKSQPLEAAAGV